MKRNLTILLITIVVAGCSIEKKHDIQINDFAKEHGKPIVVYISKPYVAGHIDYTLRAKDGAILLLTYSQLTLPDTLK